jgi:hypothetical protein
VKTDVLAKLPEEDTTAVMLGSLMYIFRLLYENENKKGNDIPRELFPLYQASKNGRAKKRVYP